jgi:hypothetical protein
MAIKTVGSISIDEIASEYNGTVPHAISEYYGAPGLPASGPIAFNDFYGKSDLYEVSGTRTTTFNTSRSTSLTTFFTTTFFTCTQFDSEDTQLCQTGRNTSRTTSRVTTITTTFATSNTTAFTSLVNWSATNPT